MNLILENKNSHVSLDAVNEFENAIIESKRIKMVLKSNHFFELFLKILRRLGIDSLLFRITKLFNTRTTNNFTILMGPQFSKCYPYMTSKGFNGFYIYDAWPSNFNYIDQMINNMRISFIYFSSQKVAEIFAKKHPKIYIKWIPEAIDISQYQFVDYKNKNIDVLQLGRKYDLYHSLIVEGLNENKINYLYERVKGEIIFPTRELFIKGLAHSKISICIPSAITHKERSGDISSITLRYWQSMASKCLILGIMPDEMYSIFDYEPIIKIDMHDPVGQINSILKNYEKYIPLIEKNYLITSKFHTWQNRINSMEYLKY